MIGDAIRAGSEWVQPAFMRVQRMKRAYQLALGGPFSQPVLQDLAKFCRAHETTFHADPRIHAALEGRREVWLHIQRYLDLTPEQLLELWNPGVKDTTNVE